MTIIHDGGQQREGLAFDPTVAGDGADCGARTNDAACSCLMQPPIRDDDEGANKRDKFGATNGCLIMVTRVESGAGLFEAGYEVFDGSWRRVRLAGCCVNRVERNRHG